MLCSLGVLISSFNGAQIYHSPDLITCETSHHLNRNVVEVRVACTKLCQVEKSKGCPVLSSTTNNREEVPFTLLVTCSGVCGVSDDQELEGEKPINLTMELYCHSEGACSDNVSLAEGATQSLNDFRPIGNYDDDVRLTQDHTQSMRAFPPTGKNPKPRRKCRVCQKKGHRKDTRWYCASCPSLPALCMARCFGDYHAKVVYW